MTERERRQVETMAAVAKWLRREIRNTTDSYTAVTLKCCVKALDQRWNPRLRAGKATQRLLECPGRPSGHPDRPDERKVAKKRFLGHGENSPNGLATRKAATMTPDTAPSGLVPYYEHGGITIYHGDAREVLPCIGPVGAVVTDPVWPNADESLAGSGDPFGLFAAAVEVLPEHERLAVWLGCLSDPRFLRCVQKPFVRQVFIEYAVPRIRSQWCLVSHDVVYLFGNRPEPRPGYKVIPGRYLVREQVGALRLNHPCARSLPAARYVIDKLTEPQDLVLDPFMGVGTTLVAAKECNRSAIGIEVEERHCETAARRLAQEVFTWT